mgnify:CR=1 FL=1
MTITAALILLLSATYYLLRPRKSRSTTATKTQYKARGRAQHPAQARSPFQATSIIANACGCDAVKALGKQRFLTSGPIPKLPLPECSAASCDCRYVRHGDRRTSQDDRRAIYSLQTDLYTAGDSSERRARRGRRETDRIAEPITALDYSDIQWNN